MIKGGTPLGREKGYSDVALARYSVIMLWPSIPTEATGNVDSSSLAFRR